MLQIRRVKSIQGVVQLPHNPDLFFLGLLSTFATGFTSQYASLKQTPLIDSYCACFNDFLDVNFHEYGCSVSLKQHSCTEISCDYTQIPFADSAILCFLGKGHTVKVSGITTAITAVWKEIIALFGCELQISTGEHAFQLSLQGQIPHTKQLPSIRLAHIHPVIGFVLGSGCDVTLSLAYALQTPFKYCLPLFGVDIEISSNSFAQQKSEDALLKRFTSSLLKLKSNSAETKQQFTCTIKRKARSNQNPVVVSLPGDDVLASILLLAKTIVQRGQLHIEQMPTESWAMVMVNHLRKMGCNPSISHQDTTSFGRSGTLCLNRFKATGRKVSCQPLFLYERHVPTMAILSHFCSGQTVFRNLEQYRFMDPDPLHRLIQSLGLIGARFGEMPDGFIIDGGKNFDGFDIQISLTAALAASCAIAGFGCMGTTKVADETVRQRWPFFQDMIETVSHQSKPTDEDA